MTDHLTEHRGDRQRAALCRQRRRFGIDGRGIDPGVGRWRDCCAAGRRDPTALCGGTIQSAAGTCGGLRCPRRAARAALAMTVHWNLDLIGGDFHAQRLHRARRRVPMEVAQGVLQWHCAVFRFVDHLDIFGNSAKPQGGRAPLDTGRAQPGRRPVPETIKPSEPP